MIYYVNTCKVIYFCEINQFWELGVFEHDTIRDDSLLNGNSVARIYRHECHLGCDRIQPHINVPEVDHLALRLPVMLEQQFCGSGKPVFSMKFLSDGSRRDSTNSYGAEK
jgi:hypothetical protein